MLKEESRERQCKDCKWYIKGECMKLAAHMQGEEVSPEDGCVAWESG